MEYRKHASPRRGARHRDTGAGCTGNLTVPGQRVPRSFDPGSGRVKLVAPISGLRSADVGYVWAMVRGTLGVRMNYTELVDKKSPAYQAFSQCRRRDSNPRHADYDFPFGLRRLSDGFGSCLQID